MGHTNSTANLALPQFIGTDKPTWLGDINSAFSDIDAYAGTNDAAVSGAVADAAAAVSQAASAVSTANAANTTAGNASTAATNAVGTANNAMSLVNQTNIKIGTLANLNTTDKTSIVNAINEVYGIATSSDSVSVTADGVKTYSQVLDELYALIDSTKIRVGSKLTQTSSGTVTVFNIDRIASGRFDFGAVGAPDILEAKVVASGSVFAKLDASTQTYTDASSSVVASGVVISIIY